MRLLSTNVWYSRKKASTITAYTIDFHEFFKTNHQS